MRARPRLHLQTLDETLDFAQPKLNPSGTHAIGPMHRGMDKPYMVAITNSGRFAFVTSVAEDVSGLVSPDWAANEFVSAFVSGLAPAMDFLAEVSRQRTASRGFNIVVGDGVTVAYYCSRARVAPTQLHPGVYILSNGLLGTPWPKCEWLRGRFSSQANEFISGTFASHERGLPSGTIPAADVVPSARKENYDMCEAMLGVMCDQTVPLTNQRFHAVPPPSLAPFLPSVLTPPVALSPSLYYGTHTTVVIIIPPYGECLYAQRSLSAPVGEKGPGGMWDDSAFCRKDVVFHRLEDVAYAPDGAM